VLALIKKISLRLERLQRDARQLRDWLEQNQKDRKGAKGTIRLSNRTDNDSAKMATPFQTGGKVDTLGP
jgi:hypothetical protein